LEDIIKGQRKCGEFFKAASEDDFEKARAFLEEWYGWSAVIHPYAQIKPHQAVKFLKMILLFQEFSVDEKEINFHLNNLLSEKQARIIQDNYSS